MRVTVKHAREKPLGPTLENRPRLLAVDLLGYEAAALSWLYDPDRKHQLQHCLCLPQLWFQRPG